MEFIKQFIDLCLHIFDRLDARTEIMLWQLFLAAVLIDVSSSLYKSVRIFSHTLKLQCAIVGISIYYPR